MRRNTTMQTLFYKLRYVFVGILVVGNLFLLSLLSPVLGSSGSVKASGSAVSTMGAYDSPNAVTNGMGSLADTLEYMLANTEHSLSSSLHAAGNIASRSGHYVAATARFMTHGVYTVVTGAGRGLAAAAIFTGRGIAASIVFIVQVPLDILGFVSDAPVVSTVIKPSAAEQVPIIDSRSSTLYATKSAMAPAVQAAAQVTPQGDATPAWPIHGEITTLFGVPHWPYQPTHTGIDISDNQPSGVTPVKPFKPGRVVETIWSGSGLGNHVVIDHGGGLTSVYGHLSSISVRVGQEVRKDTALGLEGSTGASTGTHVHFEIRMNGQPVNPQNYIIGRP